MLTRFLIHTEFQVRGTVFNELDDEKLYSVIDFSAFEEQFKIGLGGGTGKANGDMNEVDSLHAFGSKRIKKLELTSLMEHTRLRNIGKELKDSNDFVIVFCTVIVLSRLLYVFASSLLLLYVKLLVFSSILFANYY